jgi:hypothetical protein
VKFVLFYHSVVSDWNHGNPHFPRGIVRELIGRGHEVGLYLACGIPLVSATWDDVEGLFGPTRCCSPPTASRWFDTSAPFAPIATSRRRSRTTVWRASGPGTPAATYPARREAVTALADASAADVIIKASGVGVFDEVLEAEVVRQRRPRSHGDLLGRRCAGDLGAPRRRFAPPIPCADPQYDLDKKTGV